MDIYTIIVTIAPSILTGAVLYYFQRKQARRDKKAETQAAMRKKESLLSLRLHIATLKLSEANALAIKKQRVNGEMEQALADCKKAKDDYYQFLNDQALEKIQEGVE